MPGPPDPAFAKQLGAPKFTGVVMGLLSRKVRKQARKLGVSYSFLFMQANGRQLRELASLYDAGHLRPIIDKTFPFAQTLEALAYLERYGSGASSGRGWRQRRARASGARCGRRPERVVAVRARGRRRGVVGRPAGSEVGRT